MDTTIISTQGIAHICVQYPKRTSNSNMIYTNFNTNNLYGESIYLHADMVDNFASNFLDRMINPFVIVIGGNDFTMPDDYKNINKLIESKKVLSIFSQNNVLENHPKIKHLPIGIDYHTLYYYNGFHEWSETICPINPLVQESELIDISKKLRPIKNTNSLALTNFHLAIEGVQRRYNIRNPIYNILKNKDCITWLPKMSRDKFWKSLDENMFVICPFGNGLDTHRVWEVICLGRVPIIEKSPLNIVYEGLPYVEIDKWDKINNEWLENQYKIILDNIEKNIYDFERIKLSYWKHKINSYMK